MFDFSSKLETWGLPLSEAAQNSIPIIAPKLPYAQETLQDYKKKHLYKNNLNSLLKKMKYVLMKKSFFKKKINTLSQKIKIILRNIGMKYLIKSYVKRLINFKNILKLKRDFRFINQQKIIIVGSGPNLDKSIFNNQENIIVSCNASAGNVYRSNLGDVKLTIVDNELIDKKIAFEKDVRSNIIKNNVLKGINLGHLISVQSNHSKDLDYTLLKGILIHLPK